MLWSTVSLGLLDRGQREVHRRPFLAGRSRKAPMAYIPVTQAMEKTSFHVE